jgi:hypothetical protein
MLLLKLLENALCVEAALLVIKSFLSLGGAARRVNFSSLSRVFMTKKAREVL